MARSSVVVVTTDGRGILGLSREQATVLDRVMRRYFHWVESGRKFDPWQSGVASASRFDQANSVRYKSNGSGPGRYSEPDLPTDLQRIDTLLPTFSVLDRLLYAWHWQHQPPLKIDEMCERLGVSPAVYKGDWNRARTRLFLRVSGE